MERLRIDSEDHILIIVPHPDDESIGVGGLVSKYGNQCDIWLLTDGCESGGMEGLEKDEIRAIRSAEFEKAMNVADVNDYRMLGAHDGTLSFRLDMLDGAEISKYTKIFIPSPDEEHLDHVSAYEIGCNMIASATKCEAEIFCYEITRMMKNHDLYLDISDVIRQKEELILCHRSQVKNLDYVTAALAINRFRGVFINKVAVDYVEVFRSVKPNAIIGGDNGQADIMKKEVEKYKIFSKTLSQWLKLEAGGMKISNALGEKDIDKIAVYGYGVLGKCLVDYLDASGKDVKYIIDRDFSGTAKCPFFSPNDRLPEVDAIIVTAIFAFDEIKKMLQEKEECKENTMIINLQELVDHCL